MRKNIKSKNKAALPVVKVKVVYMPDGQGLKDAYRLLAKKVLEERDKRCAQQSMSE